MKERLVSKTGKIQKTTITATVDYTHLPNPLAKNSKRKFRASVFADKRKKKSRYKTDYLDF